MPVPMHQAAASMLIALAFLLTLISSHNPAQASAWQLGKGFAVFLLLLCCLEWRRTRNLLGMLGKRLNAIGSIPTVWYVGGCAAIFLLMAAGLSQHLFDGIPHVGDTHAQFVHAKIIASGHLYLPSHPLRHFFDFQNMVNDGRYYSVYAPGHPFMLALGHLLHAPWLVNPVFGALTVIATYLLAKEIGGRRTGYVAAALMLAAPFVVFMSSEYMNNATCMLFLTLFLYAYIRQHKTGDARYAIAAGLFVGYAFITRPQSTLPFALPVAMHALYAFARAPMKQWRNTLCLALPFAAWVGVLLAYNFTVNGTPWVMSKTDPMKFLTPFASWEQALTHIGDDLLRANKTVSSLHAYLFGWPTTSLIFVLLLFLLRGQGRYGNLLMACCLMQLASLIINPFYSMIFGPRYLYETSVSLIVLTAICLVRLPALIRKQLHIRMPLMPARGAIAAAVACFMLMALPAHILPWYRLYKNHYWEGNTGFYHTVMQNVQLPALVFCEQYEEFRWLYFTQPPADGNPVIFALDKKEDNQKLMDFYPHRSVYHASGDKLTRIR